MIYLFVFIGGGIGSILRFSLSLLLKPYCLSFPLSTLIVNLCGSFAIGYFALLTCHNELLNRFIVIGILGGLTTFSSFSYEMITLLNEEKWIYLLFYILSNLIGGCYLAYIGTCIYKITTNNSL